MSFVNRACNLLKNIFTNPWLSQTRSMSGGVLRGNSLKLHNLVCDLIRAGDVDSARDIALHSLSDERRLRVTVFTCVSVMAAQYNAKNYHDAIALFEKFFYEEDITPNIDAYNYLVGSLCQSSRVDEALDVYSYMMEYRVPFGPSIITYRHLTQGLINVGRVDDAEGLIYTMSLKGHGIDGVACSNVIIAFLNLGKLNKANKLFDLMKSQCEVDGVVTATFMRWYFSQGKSNKAMKSYARLMNKNDRIVAETGNALLETLLSFGRKNEAWELFQRLLDDHTPPTFHTVNSNTYNMMVNECFKDGNVAEAMDVFKRVGRSDKSKPFQMDTAGYSNLIARLCEVGMIDTAEGYYNIWYDLASPPDVNIYRPLINAYIMVDDVENMMVKYSAMIDAGLWVIPDYANKCFTFMIDKGKILECYNFFCKMCHNHEKLRPHHTTYDIVIRGLIGSHYHDFASDLLSNMLSDGVTFSLTLREFVLDAFTKDGRGSYIMDMLDRFVRKQVELFVSNLPHDIDSEKLAQLFAKIGVVKRSEVIYDRETNQSRGFGFVTMNTVEEADKAVEIYHRFEICGRLLTVKKSAPKGS